ncbi:14272_t:CDS:2 [Acaulospora colombiana]|uniref:14272_t:CDS:1 n=1 Tax=Acaulospora colombiana TaxID=27376 RepID=A0ACA9N2R7_9GLOM|nr:14272_t:CDS:2 [Acaulospora colombiana]
MDEARGRSGDPPPSTTTNASSGTGSGGATGTNSQMMKEDVGGRLDSATASNGAGGVSAKDRTDTDGDVSINELPKNRTFLSGEKVGRGECIMGSCGVLLLVPPQLPFSSTNAATTNATVLMSHLTNDVEKGSRVHNEYPAPAAPVNTGLRQIANPGPLGLSAFALTTFVLSLPNVVVGLALFYGGMVQFAAGMWEFVRARLAGVDGSIADLVSVQAVGNTFGATALSSYGGFWLSWAVIQIPGFNVVSAYNGDAHQLKTVVAFYLFGWFIFTFLMLLCVLRHSVAFIFLFLTLDLAFLMLAIADYTNNVSLTKAGGVFVALGRAECSAGDRCGALATASTPKKDENGDYRADTR